MSEGLAASRLDHISLVAERPERPLDFAALITLDRDAPSAQALCRGAEEAYRGLPKTAARLETDRWAPQPAPVPRILPHPGPEALRARVEVEVEAPLDPTREAPLQEIIYQDREHTSLLVRCHHAAADGLSLLWWVDHQLRIARGEPAPSDLDARRAPIELRQHASPRRKNRYALLGPSRSLWRRRAEPTRARRVLNLELDANRIRSELGPRGPRGFSYNDLLAASALLAARAHQEAHQARTDRLSLWFPVDIRARPFVGFGNGASRVRIYDRAPPGIGVPEMARLVRGQLEAARDDGEWHVPTDHPLFAMPSWVILAYLRRPWVDMGSVLYSHVERASSLGDELLPGVRSVETIATLDRRHPLGIAALTLRGRTHLSFTYDPGQLDEADATRFIEFYRAAVDRGLEDLRSCAP